MGSTRNDEEPLRRAWLKDDHARVAQRVGVVLMDNAGLVVLAPRDGEVTLTGVAQSEAEKALAGKLVADINGVTSVKNDMTVEEVVVQ